MPQIAVVGCNIWQCVFRKVLQHSVMHPASLLCLCDTTSIRYKLKTLRSCIRIRTVVSVVIREYSILVHCYSRQIERQIVYVGSPTYVGRLSSYRSLCCT